MPAFSVVTPRLLAHKIRYGDLYGEEETEDWVQDFFESDGRIVMPEQVGGRGGVVVDRTGEYVPMGNWLVRTPAGEYFGLSDSVVAEIMRPLGG